MRDESRDDVLPYWFPTTAVLVDDDPNFLANFSLQLDDSLAYRAFKSARAAISFLDEAQRQPPLYQRYCSLYRDGVGRTPGDRFLRFDLSLLEREVQNPRRFGEVSVVLVDYDMPEMDGVEFCKRIDNPLIKKVLFTGAADEKIAVLAFNAGLIDRFIRKSQYRVGDLINRTIHELQYQYLRQTSQLLARAVDDEPAAYLADPAFAQFFAELRRREKFVEYYLASGTGGFVCVTAGGRIARLLVLTDSDIQAHLDVAADQGAPAELIALLERREAVPAFPTGDGFYHADCGDWRGFLHAPKVVEGKRPYYVALVANDTTATTPELSYKAYLDGLDTRAAG